jgi:pimeloyl-ACP methyl ester carboxylesterase
MWDPQVETLSRKHEFIRFDDRGFGGSPPGKGPLLMDQVADDAAALLDHLGHEKAVVGGCSMGGYASFAFARRHPEKVRALVLVDTRAGADTPEGREKRRALAERVLAEGPQPVIDAFLPGLCGRTTHERRPEIVARIEAVIRSNEKTGIAHALLGMGAREDSRATLARIDVPTLVLCGAEDVLTPPSESEAIAVGIRRSRLVVLEGVGHLANVEDPPLFNAALSTFLQSL